MRNNTFPQLFSINLKNYCVSLKNYCEPRQRVGASPRHFDFVDARQPVLYIIYNYYIL